MPGMPKKGLKHSQLVYKTAGVAVDDGSHKTYRVTFIEDGVQKSAFLKKLDKKLDSKGYYPELLAKISVATSLFKRIFQGKRSAEERLVFDENDQIMGTLSIDVEGFKPFNFSNETEPKDSSERDKVIPSTKTLLDNNIMELLVGRWFLDDDDGHPHNISLAGDIDFDMFFYWFTVLIKKARFGIGVPKERVNLSVQDYETLAIVSDSKPYHWPAHIHSGEKTVPSIIPGALLIYALPKQYSDPKQFRQLASEPKAHEQKFAAVLKALLTYQPKMMRKKLEELFGNMTLNYTSLDKSLYTEYQEKYNRFCNEKTNADTFVNFIMKMYQEHYDNLYKVVVLYMGTKNNGYGVSLQPTYETLYYQPSFYKNVAAWVKNQNDTVYSKDGVDLKFDLTDLEKRYHQIWRDAYTPTFRSLLYTSQELINEVYIELMKPGDEKSPVIKKMEVKATGKDISDNTLTEALEFLGTISDLTPASEALVKIGISPDHGFLNAFGLLKKFTIKFHEIARTYYQIKREDLTSADNEKFVSGLKDLMKSQLAIRQGLMETTPGKKFGSFVKKLEYCITHVDFAIHLTTTDEEMKETITSSHVEDALPPTDPKVINKYVQHLFDWARGLDPVVFNEHIKRIIEKEYVSLVSSIPVVSSIPLVSRRQRAEPVKKFLEASLNDGGDNRLAYIFSSAPEHGGALNTLLIQHLTPLMLQAYPMPGIDAARKKGIFVNDILAKYTKAVEDYAKQDNQFTHLSSSKGTTLLYKSMYEWIDSLKKPKFDQILESALKDYENGLWSGYTPMSLWKKPKTRRDEVTAHPASLTQAQRVAKIFMDGEKTSSLNQHLFRKMIAGFQADISKQEAEEQAKEKSKEKSKEKPKELSKDQLLGRNLIKQYDFSAHKSIYEALQSTAITLYKPQLDKKPVAAVAAAY